MKKRSLVTRIVAVFLPLDSFFAASVGFAHFNLFNTHASGAYWPLYAVAWSLRACSFFLFTMRELAPVSRLERLGSRAPAEVLEAADQAVVGAPLKLGLAYGMSWAVLFLAATGYMVYLHPAPETVNPFGAYGALLIIGAVLIGGSAFAYPLVQVLTADRAGELSVMARDRGVALDRPPSSLQNRLGVLALALAAAPTLFMTSLGYSMTGLRSFEAAEQEALAATRELVLATTSESAPRPDARAQDGTGRIQAILVDQNGRPLAAGVDDPLAEMPKAQQWLRMRIRDWPEGTLQVRNARAAVAFRRIAPDRVVVAVVRASSDSARAFMLSAFAFFLTVLVWAPVSAILFSRAVVRPIQAVQGAVRTVVEQGRLSDVHAVAVLQQDEVGQLGRDFNDLLDLLRSLSRAAEQIAHGRLDVQVTGQGDLPNAFRAMLESLRSIVGQMNETSVQLASAAAEIFAATQEQETAATTQSSSMREISQTMDSLSDSASHVSDAVEGVLQNAERTLQMTHDMVRRIGELSSHVNRIGEILEAIRAIADRSDLLALNGSLEASHAGEAGRGFALVASEMRRLAERVTAAVHDVKGLVDDVRRSGSATVMATEESKKLADATTEAARRITLVTQQQRSSTQQVSESVRELTDVVSQTVTATGQTRASAESLKERADQLAHLASRFRTQAQATE